MKTIKSSNYFSSVIVFICVWVLIDLLINIAGYVICYFADPITSILGGNILQTLICVAFQSIVFVVITFLAFCIWKKKYHYVFVIIQLILFHVILFPNFELCEGKLCYVDQLNSFTLSYLEYMGQDLAYVRLSIYPFTGMFDGGFFIPEKLWYFYGLYIAFPLLHYFLLSWFSKKISLIIGKRYLREIEN